MENTISALKEILKDFPSFWDGKEAILEMKKLAIDRRITNGSDGILSIYAEKNYQEQE